MKPILVLQHLTADDPAYLGTWLRERDLPHRVFNSEAGEVFPGSIDGYAGLAILGGEMSANDDLPSLRTAESLIVQAMAVHKPVIGHCLGGQLMARALGARVIDSPAVEIGWQPMRVAAGAEAERWFGSGRQSTVFQWHYEAFELPPQARLLCGSDACPNQAFSIGPHLAMQFHIEVDAPKLRRWAQEQSHRYVGALEQHAATVQDGETILRELPSRLPVHQALADRIYGEWMSAVQR